MGRCVAQFPLILALFLFGLVHELVALEDTPAPTPPTQAPTKSPTTKSPTTKSPTTKSPTTESPTTKTPTTKFPTKTPTTKFPTKTPTTAAPTYGCLLCLHGKCNKTTYKCTCDEGWDGTNCDVCEKKCKHGYCLESGFCHCDKFWDGDLCDQCKIDCHHGACFENTTTSNNITTHNTTCKCNQYYTGRRCQIFLCGQKACINGNCVKDGSGHQTCQCFSGYMGVSCDTQTVTEARSVSYVLLASSFLSALSCLFVLKNRKKVSEVLFFRTLCDLGFAVQFMCLECVILMELNSSISIEDFTNFVPTGCWAFSFLTQFTGFSSLLWYTVLSYDYYKSVANPFQSPKRRLFMYHLVVWPCSFVSAVTVLMFGGYRPGLHLCWTDPKQNLWVQVVVFEFWLITCGVFSILVLIVCQLKQTDGLLASTLALRKTLLQAQRVGVFVFTIYWVFVGIMWYVLYGTYSTSSSALREPLARYTLDGLLTMFGCLNGLVLFSATPTNCCKCRRKEHRWQSLFREFETQRNPHKLDTISSNLRREFIKATAGGIRKLFREPLNLQSNMDWTTNYREKLLRDHPQGGGGCSMSRLLNWISSKVICIREYEPENFYRLRRHVYGIKNRTYLEWLDGDINEMAKGFVEGGSSGAFLYYSANKRLIIKTISRSEMETMIRILPSFMSHMEGLDISPSVEERDHSSFSLISRFYGVYSIKMYGVLQWFVVMENVIQPSDGIRLHQVVDLKGAWINRRSNASSDVLQDNDFTSTINVPWERSRRIFQAAWRDVAFLAKNNIMDYSILIGIHFCSEVRSSQHSHCSAHDRRPPPAITVSVSSPRTVQDSTKETLELYKRSVPTNQIMDLPDPASHRKYERRNKYQTLTREDKEGGNQPVHPDDVYVGGESRSRRSSTGSTWDIASTEIFLSECSHDVESSTNEFSVNNKESEEKSKDLKDFFGGCSATDIKGPGIYYFGIIDILQPWTWAKQLESWYKVVRHGTAGGVTAVAPEVYAQRFLLKLKAHLDLSLVAFRFVMDITIVADRVVSQTQRSENYRLLSRDTLSAKKPADAKTKEYLLLVSDRGLSCQGWESEERILEYGGQNLLQSYIESSKNAKRETRNPFLAAWSSDSNSSPLNTGLLNSGTRNRKRATSVDVYVPPS